MVLKLVFVCVVATQAGCAAAPPPGRGRGRGCGANGSEALVLSALQAACTLDLDSVQTLNCTSNNHMLYGYMHKLDVWAKKLMLSQEPQPSHTVAGPGRLPLMYSTPAKMFLFCVLLPMFAFFLFFIYVIFFTGSETTTPHIHLDYKKNI